MQSISSFLDLAKNANFLWKSADASNSPQYSEEDSHEENSHKENSIE